MLTPVDPYPNSVILWTRVAPSFDNVDDNSTVSGTVPLYFHGPTSDEIKGSKSPICVNWKVATDNALKTVISSGTAFTSSDIDYTVKVEASGLKPFTQYWYQFSVCDSNNTSPLGRTKTTPNADDDITSVSVAVYSCSNYPYGHFNSYGNSVRKDSIDYAIHLGDYIYEYANGKCLKPEGASEILTNGG
jgi:alkaline phosphatase D